MKTLILLTSLLAAVFSFPERPYKAFSSDRIWGGQDAGDGEFPFVVSVRWDEGWYDYGHICGGSILTQTHILTAAHCLQDYVVYGYFYIWAGVTNFDKKENMQRIKAKKHSMHYMYPRKVGPYDVGMLFLESPLTFNARVAPITLPTIMNENPSSSVKLIGWGAYGPQGFYPYHLQKADKRIESLPECQRNLADILGTEDTALDTRQDGSNICTAGGSRESPIAACSGDSGGPLFEMKNGKPLQVGIVAWGISPCPWPNAPSVYTKVSHVLDWINDKLKEN